MTNPVPSPRLTFWETLDVLHLAWRLCAEAWLQMPYAIVDEGERIAQIGSRRTR